MTPESIYCLIVGFILGLYTNLYVARLQKFADLKIKLRLIINKIEYISDGKNLKLLKTADGSELAQVSTELRSAGHHKAGIIAFSMIGEINQILYLASQNRIKPGEFIHHLDSWLAAANALKPNRSKLFSLKPIP